MSDGKGDYRRFNYFKIAQFFFSQPGITTETFIKKRKKETEELLFLGKMAINITNNCNK